MSLSGHFWTLWPNLRHRLVPVAAPLSVPWRTTLEDPDMGAVTLTGRWSEKLDARAALLVVHGMGGNYDRHYAVRAARAAHARGWSCLRLALRGADRSGQDMHHAGLFADIEAAVASPELTRQDEIYVLGYSLGGHVVLRYACARPAPSVQGVAAVCAPLDLETTCRFLDERCSRWYRRHLLDGLIDIYAHIAAHRAVPTPLHRMRRVRSIRQFDSLTIVPRFGFDSAEDYYAKESVASRLAELRCPTLFCASLQDPMVPPDLLRPALAHAPSSLDIRWLKSGGHVAFPSSANLGLPGPRGLESQILTWLDGQRPRA